MKKISMINEQLKRIMIGKSRFWAWETDSNDRYVYVSKNIKELLGYEPDEMLDMFPYDFMVTEDGKKFKENLTLLKLNEEAFWDQKYSFYSKRNIIIEFNMSGVPRYDENDNFCGFGGINCSVEKLQTNRDRILHIKYVE